MVPDGRPAVGGCFGDCRQVSVGCRDCGAVDLPLRSSVAHRVAGCSNVRGCGIGDGTSGRGVGMNGGGHGGGCGREGFVVEGGYGFGVGGGGGSGRGDHHCGAGLGGVPWGALGGGGGQRRLIKAEPRDSGPPPSQTLQPPPPPPQTPGLGEDGAAMGALRQRFWAAGCVGPGPGL